MRAAACRQGEEGLTQCFALCGVGVDERGDVLGMGFPPDGQLRFRDQFADAVADEMSPDDGAVDAAHDLHDAGGPDDLAAAVACQVVLVGADGVGTEALLGLGFRQPDGGDLGCE